MVFCLTNLCPFLYAQEATVKGVIRDASHKPIAGVIVSYLNQYFLSDSTGVYQFKIPANRDVLVELSKIGLKPLQLTLHLKNAQVFELNPVLQLVVEQISTVVIQGSDQKKAAGISVLDPETIRITPSANAGVESLLKSLPGVSSNNELSTQYTVRGGNFDENLVYVNDIEVYRPFLIRSGQQEGLSFVNSDLVYDVNFSAGGFQAKYGDKLSSVLDITYKTPVKFGGAAQASLLGGSVSLEGISESKKFSGILGLRYRDNSLFVNSKETETNFRPRFIDAQTFFTYSPTNNLKFCALGNLAINSYNYQPITRTTNFGTLQNTKALTVFFEGQEKDQYKTLFGALQTIFRPNQFTKLQWTASAYHTQEQEHFDILAAYFIGNVNSDFESENFGQTEFNQGVGTQLTHARNDLDAWITTYAHKGNFSKNEHQVDWGIRYTKENIRDRLQEYEIVDSTGFSIRPLLNEFRNDQPYTPFASPIVPFTAVRAKNNVTINRFMGYGQYSLKSFVGPHKIWTTIGVRSQLWNASSGTTASDHLTISPRFQFACKPDWEADMLFRISGGWYHQPPFYRELRRLDGKALPEVGAQQAIHAVLGNSYNFLLWNRPFKLTSELYYKSLTDVNTYTIENVRIRYRANNDAKAYALGFDLRMHGEFVLGTESWVSVGFLKTQENQSQRGYIARPTDQRLKFGVLFQDYVPTVPNLKMYLNMVYQTAIPGGSPAQADPYLYQTRLDDYTRADLGISYIVIDNGIDKSNPSKKSSKQSITSLDIGFEIYNIFDASNSITNTFVRDAASRVQFAIPNLLTPRVFNFKMGIRF